MNRLGQRFVIDNHMIDDPSPEAAQLRRYHDEGWITLTRTDVLGTELLGAPLDKRDELLRLADRYTEHLGPFTWGHSRWDHMVWGTDEDDARTRTVFALLFPSRPWESARPQQIRDALHVSTAVRYAADAFITRDAKLLAAAPRIREAFNGFAILSPDRALAFCDRLMARYRIRTAGHAEATSEPKPPGTDDKQ